MLKTCVVTVLRLVGGAPAQGWGARHRAFQSEPLALVGKVYAWAWCLGCPRNAARAVAKVP